MSVKRKLAGTALLFALLVCTMGAGSITFGPNQPTPNPKGAPGVLEGSGTFVVDNKIEFFGHISFYAVIPKTAQTTAIGAKANNPNWNATLVLAPQNYDSYAVLFCLDIATGDLNEYRTKKINVNVK